MTQDGRHLHTIFLVCWSKIAFCEPTLLLILHPGQERAILVREGVKSVGEWQQHLLLMLELSLHPI